MCVRPCARECVICPYHHPCATHTPECDGAGPAHASWAGRRGGVIAARSRTSSAFTRWHTTGPHVHSLHFLIPPCPFTDWTRPPPPDFVWTAAVLVLGDVSDARGELRVGRKGFQGFHRRWWRWREGARTLFPRLPRGGADPARRSCARPRRGATASLASHRERTQARLPDQEI